MQQAASSLQHSSPLTTKPGLLSRLQDARHLTLPHLHEIVCVPLQEVVLAQWATKLASLRVGGGERWTGTIESEEDGAGDKQWRMVRRVVVPPGVMLQQVYRCGKSYPTDDAASAALQHNM